MPEQIPSVGQIVHYKLSPADADGINRRRGHAAANLEQHRFHATGVQIHVGNHTQFGQIYPMLIVKVWVPGSPISPVNGQVMLDGNDALWVTSVQCGLGDGQFTWPERV